MAHYNSRSEMKAYVFKKWLIWLGWIVVYYPEEGYLYGDDTKQVTMTPQLGLPYLAIAFSQQAVIRKLKKWIAKEGKKYAGGIT